MHQVYIRGESMLTSRQSSQNHLYELAYSTSRTSGAMSGMAALHAFRRGRKILMDCNACTESGINREARMTNMRVMCTLGCLET